MSTLRHTLHRHRARGAALLAFCRDKLQAVEDQIKVLDAGSLKTWSAQ